MTKKRVIAVVTIATAVVTVRRNWPTVRNALAEFRETGTVQIPTAIAVAGVLVGAALLWPDVRDAVRVLGE